MKIINNELVKEYKKIELAIKEQEKNMAGLGTKLELAKNRLKKYKTDLDLAETSRRSKDLTTVEQIKNARDRFERTKTNVGDCTLVMDNISLAFENSRSLVRDLNGKKGTIQKKIWQNHIEKLRDDISKILGERKFEYWCSIIFAIPGVINICNFGCPEELNKFINRKDDLKKYKDKLFDKIINNGTQ